MTTPVPPPAQTLYWLGGNIDVRVEVDTGIGSGGALWDVDLWDTGVWSDTDADWQDFTPYVLSVDTWLGAQRWGERMEAGGASILVDNTTGIFTPDSDAVAPWYREFRLGRLIRVVVIPNVLQGVKIQLFTGRLDAVYDSYEQAGFDITATLSCIDFMGDWSAFNPLASTATGAQRTDLRVQAALDRYGWTGSRQIQTGSHNVQTSDLAQSTLEEAQTAADAEGSIFFAEPNGSANFKNRDWLTTDSRSVNIQGYVGYDDVPIAFDDLAAHLVAVEVSWELARLVNDVQFARSGGSMQQAEDIPSQDQYGARTYNRTDYMNTTDGEVLALAVRYLNSYKDSRLRIDAVTVLGVEDPTNSNKNSLLWGTKIGDRLSVLLEPPFGWSVERELHVFGIQHSITADDWQVTFRLDDAQTIELTYWILGDAEFGILGETTRLA